MNPTIEKTIDQLKRNAKRLAKEKGLTHSQALDILANELGYKNWSLLHKQAMKAQHEGNL